MLKRNSALALVLLILGTSACLGQAIPPSYSLQLPDHGFSSYTTLSESYDSSANWTSIVDSTVGFQFNRVIGISIGAPFYLAYNQPLFNSNVIALIPGYTPQFTPISGYNVMGDLRFGVRLATPTPIIKYVVNVTGTAPTGNTSIGISTGRFTGDFNNHIELSLGRIAPLLELGIANSNSLINMVKRPYTTLGMLSHFKAGLGLPLGKTLSLELAGYENLPLGLQKLYSQEFNPATGFSSSGLGSSVPIYEQFARVIGNGFTEDNGFTTGLKAGMGRYMDMGFTYDHSGRQKLDSFAFSIGIRVGRAPVH